MFRRLAVFAGGFTLDAAEAVTDADSDLDVLDGSSRWWGRASCALRNALEPRYRMLKTIREFALEHLTASDDADRVQDAHAQYVSHISQEFDQSMFTSRWREWQVRLSTEMLNLRAALTRLDRRRHTEALLILASGSWWALWQRGSHPGCAGVVGAGPGCSWTGCARGPGVGAWGSRPICAWNHGDNEAAERLARAGVDLSLAEGFDACRWHGALLPDAGGDGTG